jgi:hypothetical protein
MFKIRMNRTVQVLGSYPMMTFHKGTSYNAIHAVNQPNWRKNGLVFASKRNGHAVLLEQTNYTVLPDK